MENQNDASKNLLESENPVKIRKDRIFLEWSNINYTIKIKVKKDDKKKDNSKVKIHQLPAENEEIKTSTEKNESNQIMSQENTITDPSLKTILKDVEGFAKPYELLAIMGPSGCGKTSLLNIIAQRQLPDNKAHHITRSVKANNIPMDGGNFGKICAYVMQDDILMDCLTPRESLIFGAKLKLRENEKLIMKRVEKLIRQFGLEKCADSKIGSVEQKGISGGERKRTSIAYEIISNPPIVIIDEPTTGMDSFTSLVIVKYLKQLAKTGKTISKLS
jgi:ABC-type multidrug transport system ATPase subunit